jgi:hypothetical protein
VQLGQPGRHRHPGSYVMEIVQHLSSHIDSVGCGSFRSRGGCHLERSDAARNSRPYPRTLRCPQNDDVRSR